jgi:hypothetical protein
MRAADWLIAALLIVGALIYAGVAIACYCAQRGTP